MIRINKIEKSGEEFIADFVKKMALCQAVL
jgi:hypothetical protein